MKALSLLALGLLAATVGCSQDRQTFRSTPHLPASVAVMDTVTQDPVWEMNIPLQHELVVDFERDGETEWSSVGGWPATHMRWWLYDMTRERHLVDKGRQIMPGAPLVTRLSYYDPSQAPVAELPAAAEPTTPTQTPVQESAPLEEWP